MAILTSQMLDLDTYQQQAVIDLLLAVQNQKPITKTMIGLLGYNLTSFPSAQIHKLFAGNAEFERVTRKLFAEHYLHPASTVNLPKVINGVIEAEVERRIEIALKPTQQSLLDLAAEEDETTDNAQ